MAIRVPSTMLTSFRWATSQDRVRRPQSGVTWIRAGSPKTSTAYRIRSRTSSGGRVPEHLGGGQITVRLHQDEDDRRRKFNRTENVRPIPPSDPDFPRLYGRRNDSESLNRSLEDTLFLGRAHSLGWRRQKVEMLGWALMVNALTMARHRSVQDLEAAA